MQLADPLLIALIFCCAAYLVALFAVRASHGIRAGSGGLLELYGVLSIAWVVVQGLQRLQELGRITGFDLYALARISLYLLLAQAVVLFQVTRLFERRQARAWLWWGIGVAWLLAAVALYENLPRLPEWIPLTPNLGLVRWQAAYAMLVMGWGFHMGSAILLTIRTYRTKASPLHRNRTMYWSMALILAVAGQALFLGRLALPGNLLHLLAVMAIVYVVPTYNLPDLRLGARRAGSYLVMTTTTAAVYAGVYVALQALFRDRPGVSPLLAGIVLALLLALLFNPLLNRVQRFLIPWIAGAHYDPRQTLSEYSKSVSNILDIDLLAAIVVGLVGEAMGVTQGALVTVHYEPEGAPGGESAGEPGGVYVLRPVSGAGEPLPEVRLPERNPAVYYLRREHHPLTQYDIDLQPRFQDMQAEERAWFDRLGMDVYVPIYAKDLWIGLLVLGPKTSGDRYFDDDLALLQTLADQTAVALENARLYQDLKLRNAENERLNTNLREANEELARLDQAKSDFINIASHELRTPLTQVMGYNDILGEMIRTGDLEHETGVQMVESVRKAARRLEEIVDTMFDVSKLESKTLDLSLAPVSPASVISAAIETWARGMEARGQTITVKGVSHLPLIQADGKRLTQVFSHLIQNAIKSTPDGGQIRITGDTLNRAELAGLVGEELAESLPGGEQFVELVVADNGIGIAAEDLERIFEKFYRVGNVLLHSSGETKFKGAGPGLGLTIARGIVEAHGGEIWAESPGYDEANCPGSEFHVLLPVRQEPG